ncbi:unnamed protein product [Prunus armeniaca]
MRNGKFTLDSAEKYVCEYFQSGQYCQAQSSCHAYLYPKKMFQLLQSAYSTISIQDAALFLGMNEDEATTSMLDCGSCFSNAYCKEAADVPSNLQSLTEHGYHLGY